MPTPPQASAAFTVNGSAPTGAVAVAAESTVTLALVSTVGVRSATWHVRGTHSPSATAPTIPSGTSTSFTMPTGSGQSYLIECVVNQGIDSEGRRASRLYSRAVVGVVNASGIVPLAVGEKTERSATHGWVGAINEAVDAAGVPSTAAYTTLANPTDSSAVPVATPLSEIVAVNVASATALRAANPNIAKIAVMAGAGGGEFYWDASSSATDNGSLVIMPTGWSGPGRWLRLDVNPAYNVKWFGAVGDGVTDDATAIQAALTAAGQSRAVFFPMGTYLVNTPINITSRKLVGERHGLSLSTGGVVLKAGAAIDAVAYTFNNPGTIDNIILDANELADYGLHMARSGGPVTWARNVVATKATVAGFFFDECQVMGAERLLAYGNLGHGVVIQDSNASRFSFIQSRQNQGHGIHVKRSAASGGVYLVNCNVENNASTPVYIEGTRSTCLLENIWIENSTEGDGIVIDGASLVNVVNCRVTGFSDGTHRAYRLTNGTKNCLITGSCAAPGDGNESFASIEIAAGCRNNRVFGNYRISDIVTWSLAVNYEDRNWVDQMTVGHQTAAPSSGTWERGDIIWNSTPSAGGAPGWVCVTGGTPGTWKAMADLEA